MNWLRGPKMAVVWTVLRLWVGYQWMAAGYEKLTGGFDATGFLKGALAQAGGEHPAVQGWYAQFLQHAAIPNAGFFNAIIPWGEFLTGLGLVLGLFTVPALLAGAFMNLNFMLAGTVSTNPLMYTEAILLLFAGAAAYHYGLDRLAVPLIRNKAAAEKWFHHRHIRHT